MGTPKKQYTPVPKCKGGCIHAGKIYDLPCCNYIFNEGHPRPCPPGKDCTVYEKGKKSHTRWLWWDD